jgi:prepilin-type N-terminal cleavage/methylation domain-containing protein
LKLAHSRNRRAFTLIEIMVSIAIFMFIIAAIYSTWALVMKATVVGQAAAAQAQRERITVRTIEDSLMCIQSFQASPQYYSFIVDGSEDKPTLSFTARLPDIFPRGGKFTGYNLRRVTYTLEPDDDGTKSLVLRQNPVLMDMDGDEQKYPLVLARNVKSFQIGCWDTNQLDWVTEWDNTNSIPPMIKIGLVLGSKATDSGPGPELTVVRAFSMPSEMMPVAVERGAGGFGGPGGPQLNLPGGGGRAPAVPPH